jgi:hypothetical protein
MESSATTSLFKMGAGATSSCHDAVVVTFFSASRKQALKNRLHQQDARVQHDIVAMRTCVSIFPDLLPKYAKRS